jgi:hypothetical protein
MTMGNSKSRSGQEQERNTSDKDQRRTNATRPVSYDDTLDVSTMNGLMNDLNSSISEFSHEILRWAFKMKPRGYGPPQPKQYERLSKLVEDGSLGIYLGEMGALRQTPTDVVDALVSYLVCDELQRHIFIPFAPCLGPVESESLHELYRTKMRRESQEACAQWRAKEFHIRALSVDDERLVQVSNQCIQRLSDLTNILFGKKLPKKTFNDALYGVFKASVHIQSLARTRYFHIDYNVTLPSSGDPFDPTSMIPNNPSRRRPATVVWLPISLCLAGRMNKQSSSTSKASQYEIAVKAEVVADNWDPAG